MSQVQEEVKMSQIQEEVLPGLPAPVTDTMGAAIDLTSDASDSGDREAVPEYPVADETQGTATGLTSGTGNSSSDADGNKKAAQIKRLLMAGIAIGCLLLACGVVMVSDQAAESSLSSSSGTVTVLLSSRPPEIRGRKFRKENHDLHFPFSAPERTPQKRIGRTLQRVL